MGFEPMTSLRSPVLQTGTLNHSVTSSSSEKILLGPHHTFDLAIGGGGDAQEAHRLISDVLCRNQVYFLRLRAKNAVELNPVTVCHVLVFAVQMLHRVRVEANRAILQELPSLALNAVKSAVLLEHQVVVSLESEGDQNNFPCAHQGSENRAFGDIPDFGSVRHDH